MSNQRSLLRHLVFSELKRARIDGRRCSLVTVIVDALERAGFQLLREPSIDDMKWLLPQVFRIPKRNLSPIFHLPETADSTPSMEGDSNSVEIQGVADFRQGNHFMQKPSTGRPMEILMVEDSLTFARITMGALRKGNIEHRFTWLTDGQEALEFLHQCGKYRRAPQPDLILLDLRLPKVDGREVLAEIKSDDELCSIPVVVMTASTSFEDRIESELLDVEAYLTKPVDLRKFLELVRDLKEYWHEDMIVPAFG
jgi:chemotaxis family two-component system response regulator Rcp1